MPYAHKNSKGETYFLNSKQVTLRNGRKQTIYYFSRASGKDTVDHLPAGYTVIENPRTGLPLPKKGS